MQGRLRRPAKSLTSICQPLLTKRFFLFSFLPSICSFPSFLKVNLDSRTKCATKAFLEAAGLFADECFAMAAVGECLDMGVFNLAQAKIEQLMEKDSYQRFLKSDTFLEIVQHANKDGGKSTGNGGKHFRLGVRQSTSPTPTTSNRPNDANDRQLR